MAHLLTTFLRSKKRLQRLDDWLRATTFRPVPKAQINVRLQQVANLRYRNGEASTSHDGLNVSSHAQIQKAKLDDCLLFETSQVANLRYRNGEATLVSSCINVSCMHGTNTQIYARLQFDNSQVANLRYRMERPLGLIVHKTPCMHGTNTQNDALAVRDFAGCKPALPERIAYTGTTEAHLSSFTDSPLRYHPSALWYVCVIALLIPPRRRARPRGAGGACAL